MTAMYDFVFILQLYVRCEHVKCMSMVDIRSFDCTIRPWSNVVAALRLGCDIALWGSIAHLLRESITTGWLDKIFVGDFQLHMFDMTHVHSGSTW